MSIGPIHNGAVVCPFWRIWSQGDEFYLAQRDAAKETKVSFHSRGNWHIDLGANRKKLGPARPLSVAGWRAALQLKFLVHQDFHPVTTSKKFKASSNAIGIKTPPGSKLVVNVLTGPSGAQLDSPVAPEVDGLHILVSPLRSEGSLVVTASVHALEADDILFIEQARSQRITYTNPQPSEPNGQLMMLKLGPLANVLVVAPMSKQSIALV